MEKPLNETKEKAKRRFPDWAAALVCLAVAAAILFVPGFGQQAAPAELGEYASVSAICELATLRCFYHNVAIYEEKPGDAAKVITDVLTWPFNTLLKTGYKQFWLEYDGIVEMGVDADLIRIGAPDARGVVEVYVPEARVLGISADENSLSDPIDETGLFTSISSAERVTAYTEAQKKMRQEAESDQALLRKARNNAKLLLERYIVNLGRETGKTYTVRWTDRAE